MENNYCNKKKCMRSQDGQAKRKIKVITCWRTKKWKTSGMRERHWVVLDQENGGRGKSEALSFLSNFL